MARLKYAPGATPIRNEHDGYTFIPNHYGQSVLSSQKNDRYRRPAQDQRKRNIGLAIDAWRNLSAANKNAWSVFAATYPQPAKSDPDVSLSGYQLFIKRNSYCFLNNDLPGQIIIEPELASLPDPAFTIRITQTDNVIDLTDLYIARFGLLPQVGQFVICKVLPIALNSGQFFAPFIATIEVENVYMDGLFASFEFVGDPGPVSFSLYLSKPVHESVQYPSTKFRYMGCFKPTTFLQLTDTPDNYTGQADKVVSVKPDESGLEFVTPGGGGLTCEDIPDCPSFQQLQEQVNAIGEVVSKEFDTSIPPVNFGLLYNLFALISPLGLSSDPSWATLDQTLMDDLVAYLGGFSSAFKLKQNDFLFWEPPNTGASNSSLLNWRGSGTRSSSLGIFNGLRQTGSLAGKRTGFNSWYIRQVSYNSSSFGSPSIFNPKQGFLSRLWRSASGVPDGVIGSYVGNNGRVYRTITINGLELLADNLAETKFRDGSLIPVITDNTAWSALTTAALCAYANDWANV